MAIYERFFSESNDPARADGWRTLPVLSNGSVTLREVQPGDAASLRLHLNTGSVRQYIAAPPSSVDGFRQFIRWTRRQRRNGSHLCFGAVPAGQTAAVGVFQLWRVEPDFSTAEWGLAIGEAHWGTGLAAAASRLLLDYAFDTLGVERLEARCIADNARGNGLLSKLGATREGTLRHSGPDAGRFQVMWSLLAQDRKAVTGGNSRATDAGETAGRKAPRLNARPSRQAAVGAPPSRRRAVSPMLHFASGAPVSVASRLWSKARRVDGFTHVAIAAAEDLSDSRRFVPWSCPTPL